ncbi:MAG TPA: hypothetical protein VJQ43_04025 [Thermoplasmata archaeon]|nr:hypothetical protein [Thermoplasmata archaeon]
MTSSQRAPAPAWVRWALPVALLVAGLVLIVAGARWTVQATADYDQQLSHLHCGPNGTCPSVGPLSAQPGYQGGLELTFLGIVVLVIGIWVAARRFTRDPPSGSEASWP